MHSYQAFMPMGEEREMVHLKAHGRNPRAQFVCFENAVAPSTIRQDVVANGTRYFVTLPKLDAETLREALARINMCALWEIEIVDVKGQVVRHPDVDNPSRWELVGRKRNRFNPNNFPPPGWQPR